MERELDVQLFRRKARGVELTPAGRAFEEKARTVLADLDEAYEVWLLPKCRWTGSCIDGSKVHISLDQL
jgi:DNA-binding transcriptional LysR family regulator